MVILAIEQSGFEPITELINGGALGIDAAARTYWHRRFQNKEPDFPLRTIQANWDRYGKSAGPIRNREMARNADALIAIWDGVSRGTSNMIETAKDLGLKVHIYRYEPYQLR
jgi:glycerophosphoryl diester phosphodiesterase